MTRLSLAWESNVPPPQGPERRHALPRLVLTQGPALDRLARLVPMPLPNQRFPSCPTMNCVCTPLTLRISLSNEQGMKYFPCMYPRELWPLYRAMCRRLLGRHRFCRELRRVNPP